MAILTKLQNLFLVIYSQAGRMGGASQHARRATGWINEVWQSLFDFIANIWQNNKQMDLQLVRLHHRNTRNRNRNRLC